MTNSLATFQTMMNDIFHNLIAESIMVVYLSDIMIFTQTLEGYHRAIAKVLEILAQHKLYFQLEKCEFNRQQIKYLSLVILKDQVEIDLVKMARVDNQSTSKNCTDLQVFLDFTNFYWRFIYGFSKMACLFFDLTRSNSIQV